MIEIREHPRGVVIHVYAQPGAKRNAILGEHASMLKISVTKPPENGKANVAIAELLADHLGIAKSNVVQLSGKSNRRKQFLIQDGSLDALHQLFSAAD